MRRILIITAASALAACEPEVTAEAPDPGPRPVKIVTVTTGADQRQYSYPALVLPAQEAKLSFRVSGKITDLPVRAMNEVVEGDLIARLDPRDFDSSVSQVESQLVAARAQLKSIVSGARQEDVAVAQANIASAQAQREQARAKAKRTLTLYRKGIESRAAMDTDLAALKVADAALKAAQQELAKGQSGGTREEVQAQIATIDGLESQLQTARAAEGDTELRAPFSGIIADRSVENFANVQANEVIVTLQSLENLDLSFDLPGPDVVRFAGGAQASSVIVFDAAPGREFPAELVEFSTQADPQTQTFRGRVRIDRPEDIVILPGMSARLIATQSVGDGGNVSVPENAVMAAPDGAPLVWIVSEDNTVDRHPVAVGEANGGFVQVPTGLKTGDRIVTAGLQALQPGMSVRPVTKIGD